MDSIVTILIVDDKPANIFATEKLLEKPGRTFLSASNGKDGLMLALNNAIDLIILDVQMPEMDGFEVAKILQSNKRTKDVPIIFASAEKKERQSVMKGFEEGAIDYLSKPLDPELTIAKVSVLLKIQLQKKELIEKNRSLEKADQQIKQLNSDLQRNLIQLESMNKELESFSYSISHDLRAPLRSLIGYTSMLEEDYASRVDDKGKEMIRVVQKSAQRMNQLIDDLLEFSRTGKKELQKTKLDTDALVRRITSETGNKAAFGFHELFPAFADPALLTQVWVNLISNAVKYSSKKETPIIEIGSQKKENEIIYYVKDNGAGFSMQYAEKLFGVFQRLHKPSDFEGTGVGLAIVQRIVARHGGRVWAESAVNEGATFYFSLPAMEGSSEL